MKKLLLIFFSCLSLYGYGQFITNSNGITITNSAVLSTNGSWQNSGSFLNNGKIITSESWTNTGTMDRTSTGGFVLNYTVDRNFSAGSNSTEQGYIEKNGGGKAILTGKVYVRDSLKITGGIIKANTGTDTVGLLSNTFAIVATGSYVEGPMAKKSTGTSTISFPTGLNGDYLPIKFVNTNSGRVGVIVEAAPAGYTAGDAVASLIGFPYVWRTTKKLPADTADYVEVKAPDSYFVGYPNISLARKVGTSVYEGMGSRLTSSSGGITTVQSYSKGLKGTFTLASGYPGNMATDLVELHKLYDSTSGNGWTLKNNWVFSNTPNNTWTGLTEKGGRIVAIRLPSNNLVGYVPATIVNMAAVRIFNVSTNSVTSIPDMTSIPALDTLNVSSNELDFSSLEENAALISGINKVSYEEQAPLSDSIYIESPVTNPYHLELPDAVGGTANKYQWKFKPYYGGTPYADIPGATSETYDILPLNRSRIGKYKLIVTNQVVTDLTLTSGVFEVEATADISGTLKFGSPTPNPVSGGLMQLLQVTPGGYDTIRAVQVSTIPATLGRYTFADVKLRDYLINGFADTLVTTYKKALPTWYTHTIYWEEANTLVLEDNITGLDIVSEIRPEHPTAGPGILTGAFYETLPDGGRITKKGKVVSAGVSVQRVERTGRGKDEILTLIDYLFTDDEGAFTFNRLDAAEYRLNLQYPGYPMDKDSYITIPIVDNLFGRQVGVEAEVIAGKVFVRKLVITGWEEENHLLQAYPNPTVEFVYITNSEEQDTFTMIDPNGKEMKVPAHWDVQTRQWEVDVRELKPGVYILQINQQGKTEKLRIVVK